MKRKDIVESKIFDISELFIQCNKGSCCVHITGGVNICLHGCVSFLGRECGVSLCVCMCVCVCVCVRDIKSEYKQKITCQISANLMASGTKVPRLHMWRSVISLSKIAHQIRHNHPFSQRNKATERALGVGVGGYRGREGFFQNLKRGEVGKIGGGGVEPLCLCQLWVRKVCGVIVIPFSGSEYLWTIGHVTWIKF